MEDMQMKIGPLNSELYAIIQDDDLRGNHFYEATVRSRWFSRTREPFNIGERLIVQKTNQNWMVIKSVLRDGKFRSVAPAYDPAVVYLIQSGELTDIQPRPKLAAFEGIDKFINPQRATK